MSIVLKGRISNSITPAAGVTRDIADGTRTINLDTIHQLPEVQGRSRNGCERLTSFVLQLNITIAPSELPKNMRLPFDENAAA
jgi:hypothetical protein